MATVTISIDMTRVDELFTAFQRAIDPGSLMLFLQTEGEAYWTQDLMDRFMSRGDKKTGKWPDLAESTKSIRWDEGFSADDPNVRSGDMERWLFKSIDQDIQPDVAGASMSFPGDPPDSLLEEKLRTAQEGKSYNIRPGYGPTPARPVLAADETDLAAMLQLLSMHIIMYAQGYLR